MTVFKTFWKCVKKNIGMIIMYTVMLIAFGTINMKTSDNQLNFVNVKPDILIINEDNSKISDNLIKYIENNSNIVDIKQDEEAIDDALFYRDVNYIIYIPKNYGNDILKGLNPKINIQTTGDYLASLSELLLSRYIQIQNVYRSKIENEDELIKLINDSISKQVDVQITSKLDTAKTNNASNYFNFASYSIMAVIIFIICLVLTSFKEKTVKKRNIISSMNYKKYNRLLLIASLAYATIVWLLYVILGIIVLKDIMFTSRGLIYMLNTFIFTFCSLTIALFISSLVNNKNAISGIVNVVALSSAFLCGAFVPAQYLPESVLNIAHILPSYWYINSNDLLRTIETINIDSLTPILVNSLVMIGFSILFIILNNVVSKRKQKVG